MARSVRALLLSLFVGGLAAPSQAADVVFFDDFNDGWSGWTASGTVSSHSLTSLIPDSVRLRNPGTTVERTISTVGYTGVRVSLFMAADLLEGADACYAEVSDDGGQSWTSLIELRDGEDDEVFRWAAIETPALDDNPAIVVRYRNGGNALSDNCFGEDVLVEGVPPGGDGDCQPWVQGAWPGTVDDFDPLGGAGAVTRTDLTASQLDAGGALGSPLANAAYALPADAAPPLHQFNGRLELHGEATSGSFAELLDSFNYTGNGDDPRKHLPDFDYEFAQTGSHLVPVHRGIQLSPHPYWEYIVEPGRVWSETGDGGRSRASFPFVLQQKNSNCLHNGLMTFLFDDTEVSGVAYQIVQETCLYYQFDMSGLLDATYQPYEPAGATAARVAHQVNVANRMPAKPIADLAVDYPGADPSRFGNPSDVSPQDMTLYGYVIDGTNYVSSCPTRYGDYPYCDVMRVPSYSTAKTAFASAATMRMEVLYPGLLDETIATWVPEAAADGDWDDVSIAHALDMATGNYNLSAYSGDEDSLSMNDFFLPLTHTEKVTFATGEFPRKAAPGTSMHYHTSDTYLALAAAEGFLRDREGSCRDIFRDVLVDQLWRPLGVSAGSLTTRRTYDAQARPFGGYGLSYLKDDVAKIAKFMGPDHGRLDGVPVLDPAALSAGKMLIPGDPGLVPFAGTYYNNAFWGKDRSAAAGCTALIPYLSGYGGITIALMPNRSVYYSFSDGGSFVWDTAFAEAQSIRDNCAGLVDADSDGWLEAIDNCGAAANSSQADLDGDGVGDACDADLDGDGEPNASDCADSDRSVSLIPGSIGASLRLAKTGGAELSWSRAAQGHAYNVYRGSFSGPAGIWPDNESCFDTELVGARTRDPAIPASGSLWYYRVRAVNACGESGSNTGTSCPAQGRDTDADGRLDVADNCASVANQGQADFDGDFVGDACDVCPADPDPGQTGVACP